MAQAAMTIRLDNKVKAQFDSLCEQFGMSANAAVNVFINAVVRSRAIPFRISAGVSAEGQYLLDALYTPHLETPEMTLEEINEEIRAARRERAERERQKPETLSERTTCGDTGRNVRNSRRDIKPGAARSRQQGGNGRGKAG